MMQSTFEQVVNDRFNESPVDIALERPMMMAPDATPVTATPAAVAVVVVVRAVQFGLTAYVSRHLPN